MLGTHHLALRCIALRCPAFVPTLPALPGRPLHHRRSARPHIVACRGPSMPHNATYAGLTAGASLPCRPRPAAAGNASYNMHFIALHPASLGQIPLARTTIAVGQRPVWRSPGPCRAPPPAAGPTGCRFIRPDLILASWTGSPGPVVLDRKSWTGSPGPEVQDRKFRFRSFSIPPHTGHIASPGGGLCYLICSALTSQHSAHLRSA